MNGSVPTWYYHHRDARWTAAANPAYRTDFRARIALKESRLDSWGTYGGHLGLKSKLEVPALGAMEMTAYLVLADSREEARRYAVLKHLP